MPYDTLEEAHKAASARGTVLQSLKRENISSAERTAALQKEKDSLTEKLEEATEAKHQATERLKEIEAQTSALYEAQKVAKELHAAKIQERKKLQQQQQQASEVIRQSEEKLAQQMALSKSVEELEQGEQKMTDYIRSKTSENTRSTEEREKLQQQMDLLSRVKQYQEALHQKSGKEITVLTNLVIKMDVDYILQRPQIAKKICEEKDVMAFKSLLNKLEEDIDVEFGSSTQTLLMMAADNGFFQAVEMLCLRGANPQKLDKAGKSAVYYLASQPHIMCVQYIFKVPSEDAVYLVHTVISKTKFCVVYPEEQKSIDVEHEYKGQHKSFCILKDLFGIDFSLMNCEYTGRHPADTIMQNDLHQAYLGQQILGDDFLKANMVMISGKSIEEAWE